MSVSNFDVGNTTNLRAHIRTNHVTEHALIEKKRQQKVAEKMIRTSVTSCSSSAIQKAMKQPLLQSTLLAASSTSKFDSDHPKQILLNEKIASMICKDLQPYSIVEDPGFREVIKAAEPRYVMPTRRTFAENIIPRLHSETVNNVKADILNAASIAITTDAWTSRSTQSYISYTAHFLTPHFIPKNYCLKVEHADESHTAVNLAKSLSDRFSEWTSVAQRENKLKIVVVTDNASNVQAAVDKLPQCTHLNCFDHTLQLAINDTVKNCTAIQETILKAKTIVTHFKHSSKDTMKLLALEEQMGLPKLKLKQECPTRWNSRYDMLERLVAVKDPASAMVASMKNVPSLLASEWEAAQEYVRIFKPLKILTAVMSASTYPTLSMVIPELNKLKHTLSLESMESACLPTVTEDLLASIDRRWPRYETTALYAIATLVDPRYKDCGFDDETAAAYANNLVLTEMMTNLEKSAQSDNTDQNTTVTQDPMAPGIARHVSSLVIV